MQGWESVRWLVIGIPLPENRKVGSFLRKNISCFLIETKFISKLFKKFRRQNESQEVPRLRLFMIWSYYHILKSNKKTEGAQKKNEVRYTGLPKILIFRFSDFQNSYIPKIIPHVFLIFPKGFDDNREGYGSRFWRNFGSSRNHLKSIGIWPGTLISHFGIIKTP